MASSTPSKLSRFDLPGFTLPLKYIPYGPRAEARMHAVSSAMNEGTESSLVVGEELFPHALCPDEAEGLSELPLTTLAELRMLQLMNKITDIQNWETKVFDDVIVAHWKDDTQEDWITPAMFRWIIQELRYKAEVFNETKAVSVFNGDVVKSDSKVPKSLREALKAAVMPLEAIPEAHRDYHPGSNGQVVDLVHPSLFPLIYGRSRILPDKLAGLGNCLEMIARGTILPCPPKGEIKRGTFSHPRYSIGSLYSRNYQWLPCEVEFEGPNKDVRITSYVNNLHPQKHQDLYAVVEQIISHAIPLWNLTLTPLKDGRFRWKRVEFSAPLYDPDEEDVPDEEKPQMGSDEIEFDFWERIHAWETEFRTRNLVPPEPGTFKLPQQTIGSNAADAVDLIRDYSHRGLQVIVKLAKICLTPEKPSYEGGSWHVEGHMNEHICATALYYYDSMNITESLLAFRQQSREEDTQNVGYRQNDWTWSGPVFGIENEEECVQYAGEAVCKEGRLITFPNVLQHRVRPFRLEDQSKPGHRKILALFLVDPNIRIISTANVPPQQRDWWSEHLESSGCFNQLPTELKEKVFESVDDFPIGMDEAKEIRLNLMDERKEIVVKQDKGFRSIAFSLCEH